MNNNSTAILIALALNRLVTPCRWLGKLLAWPGFALRFTASLAAFLIACCLTPALADENNMLSIGARYHAKQSAFEDLPFDDSDLSYLLAYSYLQEAAIWQFGLDVAPDIQGKMPQTGKKIDFALTPQFNLIFRDRYFRGGAGIRKTYLRDDEGEGEWSSLYWQLQLGLSLPISRIISIDIASYYVMEKWSQISSFRFADLEYGLLINYAF